MNFLKVNKQSFYQSGLGIQGFDALGTWPGLGESLIGFGSSMESSLGFTLRFANHLANNT